MLPHGCFRATHTTPATVSKLVTETPALPGWDKHLEWDHSCIHHLLHPEPIWCCPPQETFPCPLPLSGGGCFELDVHSLSQFWHRRGGREPQSRVGIAETAFTTKAFLVKLTTVCSEHTDTSGEKVRDPLPKRHCSNIFPQYSDKTGFSSTRKSSAFLWKATTVPAPSEDPENQGSQYPH